MVVLALSACGTASSSGTSSTPERTVIVLAASSLTESFDRLSEDFEAEHPGVTVDVSYGSSATLVQQVNQGAPADVLALAGETAMDALDPELAKSSQVFASNVLEIAVPPDNPGQVHDINDLARPDVKVVLCAETVPCGQAAGATFKKARILPNVVSREMDVKATLAKIRLGEADAAVVYRSDVVAAKGAITGVPIREPFNTSLRYPIITLTDDNLAAKFVEHALSTEGQATLEAFGLGPP
jgi:molybdate transport system substrate-binding protein